MNNDTTNNTDNEKREKIEAARSYKLPEDMKKKEEEPTITPIEEEKVEVKVIKKKSVFGRIFFVLLIALGAYTLYSDYRYNNIIENIEYNNSPVSTMGDEKELDINSSFVQGLYNKVKTSIREDISEDELNDSMKLYLAFRQIPNYLFYTSNCEGFDDGKIVPYTCPSTFEPKAFKADNLKIEYEKLFGEGTFNYGDIQIGRNCVGGYQYIENRGEYVQGFCNTNIAVSIKGTKELKKAISYESTIILKEEVKYTNSNGGQLPGNLESGTYLYIFKLDKNYNYIYITKELERE